MQNIEQFLRGRNHSPATIRTYTYYISRFLKVQSKADQASYRDILNHMAGYTKQGLKPRARQLRLVAIKKYYDYLIDTGIREDHPCRNLLIKGTGKGSVIFSDLFTSDELELLMQMEERYEHLRIKNQLIISLLIYQALLPYEIIRLKVDHIDLDKGIMFIQGGRICAKRWLDLYEQQLILLENYLQKTRKRLLQISNLKSDYLLLNYRGKNSTVDDVQFLVQRAIPLFPGKKINPKVIRDSVIANLLNEKQWPVEQVQLFAGHRWISSTLRYQQNSHEKQREMVNKWFPLKD